MTRPDPPTAPCRESLALSDDTRISASGVVRGRKSRGRASKRRSNLKRALAFQHRRASPVEFTIAPRADGE